MELKEYLVDVPVKINIWIRPDCQRKQFQVIQQARPSILFLISDGGRNQEEQKIIKKNRQMYEEEIDWNCTVYKLYEEVNQGMYAMAKKEMELVWSKVDCCIFLEDDILPSVSYFQYCQEMLEKYKDDKRIGLVCGMNHLGVYKDVTSDYFFSKSGSIWGVAMWKRSYENYYHFNYYKDPYIMKLLKCVMKENKMLWKRTKQYAVKEYYNNHVAGDEFFLGFSVYGYSELRIIPKYNLISNIGCTKEAAHSAEYKLLPHGIRRVFHMKTYELKFPLKHPEYMIPDKFYKEKEDRIMANNKPIIAGFRWVEGVLLKIRYGQFKSGLKRWLIRVLGKARER